MTWGTQPVGLYTPTYFYYQQKKTPPPKSVPTWEKMFCWKVGNVPWRRLEETKKYMYQHENIAKWNDSAVETAFKKAKRRYWAETNGLPITSDLSLPPPYMYSDDIDWNSPSNDIDPKVISDLEKSLVPKSDDEVKIVDCNDDHDAVIIGLTSVGVNLSKYGVGWGDEFADEELKEKENVNENIEEIVCEDAGCIDLKIHVGRWDGSSWNYVELAY